MKHPAAYYDEFSHTYENGRDGGYHALVDDIEAKLTLRHARGRILEIGCGTGLILKRLRKHHPAIGADLSKGMLLRARAKGLAVVRASATALPFRDAAFGTVCSFKVLAHVPAIETATAEAARVLAPSGTALLEFYNRQSLRYWSFRLRDGAISAHTNEKDVFTRYDNLTQMRHYLPPTLDLIDLCGVRVLTPAAPLLRVPAFGRFLAALERAAAQAPFLRRFGGFLILVARRVAL